MRIAVKGKRYLLDIENLLPNEPSFILMTFAPLIIGYKTKENKKATRRVHASQGET